MFPHCFYGESSVKADTRPMPGISGADGIWGTTAEALRSSLFPGLWCDFSTESVRDRSCFQGGRDDQSRKLYNRFALHGR